MSENHIPVCTEPLEVQMVDGEVVITGPDGFCGSFTRQAAEESARRLTAIIQQGASETYQKPLG
jgi:hypothetical protein